MSSMLYAVAMAAGLGDDDGRNDVQARRTHTPSKPVAKSVTLRPARPVAPIETPEALAYIANLEARGHRIDTKSRREIIAFGSTWATSATVRQEFSSFSVFAAYSRAKARNGVRILGQQ